MDVSFVILTWNSERYIVKCLHSLLVALRDKPYRYEIFIIDNGSNDGTVSILNSFQTTSPEQFFPIYLEKNTGTTYSRNLALKQAKGQYICILDSDVEVSSETLAELSRTLEQHPQIGMVAPKLLYPNGKLQKSTDDFPTILTKARRYIFLKAMEAREHALAVETAQSPAMLREVDYAISAMWLLKREVLDKVGLLDENIFYAPEDVDYCLRIWQAGYTIVYNPNVACIHHTQEISRGLKLNKALLSHIYGLAYYFWKHHYLFRRPKNIGKRRN